MTETLMNAGLVVLAVLCAAGAVLSHRAGPAVAPIRVELVRARRDLWIVDHRPLVDELQEIAR